jgi:hypothetical protein
MVRAVLLRSLIAACPHFNASNTRLSSSPSFPQLRKSMQKKKGFPYPLLVRELLCFRAKMHDRCRERKGVIS